MFISKDRSTRNAPQKGQGLVEYALILMLVALVVIVVLMILGPQIGYTYQRVQGAVICTAYSGTIEADIAAGTVPDDAYLIIGDTSDCVAVTASDPTTVEKTYGAP